MTDARWAQVKALFHAAAEKPVVDRAAFLAAAAGSDELLRREVASLLDADDPGGALTKRLQQGDVRPSGASIDIGDRSDETRTEAVLTPLTSIGPYRVVGLLGTGGMGEVFRARDSKLNRDVALKLLPGAFAFDPDRLARFRREARALAALNHPHIAAIYGLEESEGRQGLVLELVEGITLAEQVGSGPLPVREALALAGQIAGALEAAHEKGIVHRDLKPANIKVTPAGVVKVLDFGLAKMGVGEHAAREAVHSSLAADGSTRVGAVVGTAAYMSPEQARGLDVDTRTDIWAFGCVLFEMLSGRRVFAPDQDSDSTEKVLTREPDWAALPTTTPAKVRGLLRRCLEKDRCKRLPTIGEARQLVEQLLTGRRLWSSVAIASAAVLVLAVSAAVYLQNRPPQTTSVADWVQLTNLEAVSHPALSPDGRMIAFISGTSTLGTREQLYVKRLPDGEAVPLTEDAEPKDSPVFSPDGSRIAYTRDGRDTWEVEVLRGTPRPWLENASGLAWIDSEHLVFSEIKSGAHMAIVRSTEGSGTRHDVYVPAQSGMAHKSSPSPDSEWVLIVEMDSDIWQPCRLVPIAGGASRQVGPKGLCTAAAWSPDGRWMYFTADTGDGFHVWRERFPSGEPEQITAGPTEEQGLAIAPDGKSLITAVSPGKEFAIAPDGKLVTAVSLGKRNLWVRDGSFERQIPVEGYAYWPLVSADGRRVCFRVTKNVAGNGQSPSELWVADLRSGTQQRLFPEQLVTGYDLSRDDRVVAAVQDGSGRSRVWLASLDVRQRARAIPGAEGDQPRFGRNGEIIFRVPDGTAAGLHRVSKDGLNREPISKRVGNAIGTASPDGVWLSGVSANVMSLYSTRGDAPLLILSFRKTSRMRWSRDGKHAYISFQDGPASAFGAGRTYVLPLRTGSVLPDVPPGGFRSEEEVAALPGATMIPYGDVAMGTWPSVYAYSRPTATRNLYRIQLK